LLWRDFSLALEGFAKETLGDQHLVRAHGGFGGGHRGPEHWGRAFQELRVTGVPVSPGTKKAGAENGGPKLWNSLGDKARHKKGSRLARRAHLQRQTTKIGGGAGKFSFFCFPRTVGRGPICPKPRSFDPLSAPAVRVLVLRCPCAAKSTKQDPRHLQGRAARGAKKSV